jgi:hypothetical protein
MNKSTLKIVFLIVLLLTILPLALFILVQFVQPREPATSGDSPATESTADKTTAQERHARRVEARTIRNDSREEITATVEYDVVPNPGLTAGEIADRRNGIVGAINPNGRGKQATPYRPDEVPGDSGIIVQYAGSPDDMISAPPPPEDDLWGGAVLPPMTPGQRNGIGGVRLIDPNDPFFQQEIQNPFINR